jgi:hypothetical protein
MVSTRRQKQALAAACDPLKDAGILQHVFKFLPGHWLFLGAVCAEWNAVYASIGDQTISRFSLRGNDKLVSCGAKTTLYSAAVASPATARLACELGLNTNTENTRFQLSAGFYADVGTLTTLRELGMPHSHIVISSCSIWTLECPATLVCRSAVPQTIRAHVLRCAQWQCRYAQLALELELV